MDLEKLKIQVKEEIITDLIPSSNQDENNSTPPSAKVLHPKQFNPLIMDEIRNGSKPRSRSASPSQRGSPILSKSRSGSLCSSPRGSPKTKGTKTKNIPSFLNKLYRMLCYEDSSIIEWKDGFIYVHDPEALTSTVLQKYFRHNKYTSFQRQLNYFGFRKVSRKGKMFPCAYSNESLVGKNLDAILTIQRRMNVNENDLALMDCKHMQELEKKMKSANIIQNNQQQQKDTPPCQNTTTPAPLSPPLGDKNLESCLPPLPPYFPPTSLPYSVSPFLFPDPDVRFGPQYYPQYYNMQPSAPLSFPAVSTGQSIQCKNMETLTDLLMKKGPNDLLDVKYSVVQMPCGEPLTPLGYTPTGGGQSFEEFFIENEEFLSQSLSVEVDHSKHTGWTK